MINVRSVVTKKFLCGFRDKSDDKNEEKLNFNGKWWFFNIDKDEEDTRERESGKTHNNTYNLNLN